jgi:hypothetical protein
MKQKKFIFGDSHLKQTQSRLCENTGRKMKNEIIKDIFSDLIVKKMCLRKRQILARYNGPLP